MLRFVVASALALAVLLCQPADAQEVFSSERIESDARAREVIASPQALQAGGQEPAGSGPASEGQARGPRSWILLPHLFYTPETGVAGGAVAGYYAGGGLGARPSSVLSSLTVTARRQIIAEALPEMYFDGGRLWLNGKLRAMKYPDVFFGVGNGTTAEMEEDFTSRSISLELQAQREVARGSWIGVRTQLQHEEVVDVEADRLLAAGGVAGASGGTAAGLGVVATRDTRDRTIAPRRGVLAEATWTGFTPALGSDFRFGLTSIDARGYTSLCSGVLAAILFHFMINFVGMLVEGVAWVEWTRTGLTAMAALLAVGICGAQTLRRHAGRGIG
jgi:hypothetical protein